MKEGTVMKKAKQKGRTESPSFFSQSFMTNIKSIKKSSSLSRTVSNISIKRMSEQIITFQKNSQPATRPNSPKQHMDLK